MNLPDYVMLLQYSYFKFTLIGFLTVYHASFCHLISSLITNDPKNTVALDLRGREETGRLNLIQLRREKVTLLQVSIIFVAQWFQWIRELLQGMKKVICET